MIRNLAKSFVALLIWLFPALTFAASCSFGAPASFGGLVCLFLDLILTLIPIVAGIALLVFFWGLANFILHADSDSGREKGRYVMGWGIIALFVLVSIWGIVIFLQGDILGYNTFGIPQLP